MNVKYTALATALIAAVGTAFAADQPVVGLITKTETNPFFVKMKEGATAEAKAKGAKLLSGAGPQRADPEVDAAVAIREREVDVISAEARRRPGRDRVGQHHGIGDLID